MKTVVLKATILTVCSAVVLKNNVDNSNNDNNVCDGDYTWPDPKKLDYWLYTRKVKYGRLLMFCDEKSIKKSGFNVNNQVVILVHGHSSHRNEIMCKTLGKAFHKFGDVNVISLDWSFIAALRHTRTVLVATIGRALGLFVIWLTTLGVSYDRVHLLGFGYGGHLVGNAGRVTNGRIKRITALDPSEEDSWKNNNGRLVPSDAQYVEVIHTSTVGYKDPCGHVDHYPNGGSIQPGCENKPTFCSHYRAVEYVAATIECNHTIWAYECKNVEQARRCRCTGKRVPMGNADLNKTGTGIYRADTNGVYPYCNI